MTSLVVMVTQVYYGCIGYHSNQKLYQFLSFYSIPHPSHQFQDSNDNLFKRYWFCCKSITLYFPLIKSKIPTSLYLYITFSAQGVTIDTIHRWKSYEIIFLTIYNMYLYKIFLGQVKIPHGIFTAGWVVMPTQEKRKLKFYRNRCFSK